MKLNNRYFLAFASLIVVGLLIYIFKDLVTYILIAWVISMVGAPVAKFLRRYVGNTMAAGLTLGLFLLLFTVLLWIFIPPLSKQVRNLAGIDYNQVINNLEEPLEDVQNWLAGKGLVQISDVKNIDSAAEKESSYVHTQIVDVDSLLASKHVSDSTMVNQNITLLIKIDGSELQKSQPENTPPKEQSFAANVKENIIQFFDPSGIPKLFTSIIGTLSNFMIALFSVLFIAFFFLQEQALFNNIISGLIPDKYVNQSIQAINQTSTLLIRYFTGILGQISIITLFLFIMLTIFGIKNALLIAFFAAMVNVIPYLGVILGVSFAMIITISSNLDVSFYNVILPKLIRIAGIFTAMQLIDNFIIQPNVFSKSVKAHPLEIFVVILMGARIGGVAGMILAIPAYTVLRVVGKVFLSEFKIVKSITKEI